MQNERKRMNSRRFFLRGISWLLHGAGVLAVALCLSGCEGTLAYREGQGLLSEGKTEEGMAKIKEAMKHEPRNPEYRIAFSTLRASLINDYIAAGEIARREGRLSDAEKSYGQVLALDPENAMAKQGIDALTKERRHRQVIADAEELFKKGEYPMALDKLRPVLLENPAQKEALNLRARINEVRAKEQRPEVKLASTFRKSISLEFRDAPLKSVLEVVAKISGLNFFYDKDIRPDLKATIFAKKTTIEDALRLILVTNQLEFKVLNENSILIYPNMPQKLKEYQTLVVRSFYLTNADVKGVSNTIKTIVKTKDLVIDERLGIIIMRDTPEAIRMAERIVALQDMSDPEVMLEVEVMEIKRSRLLELGVHWPSQLSLTPLQVGNTPLTLSDLRNLNSSNIQATIGSAVLNARKDDQDGNILANPRIRVRNKEKAKIQIGDRVPVVTTTSTSTGFVSESVNYLDVGLKLEVEPHIYLNNEVAIKVSLEVSNLVREITSKAGTLSYQIGTRGADTILRLKDGETQILAGLISDEERSTANKVPGVGELPVLGRLFGSQKDDSQRSEILLSITPRIVRSLHRPDMVAAEFESGTEDSIGPETLRLTTLADQVEVKKEPEAPVVPAEGAGTTIPSPATQAEVSEVINMPPPPVAIGAPGGRTDLVWQAPTEIRVGEQFTAVLKVNSQHAFNGMPLLVGFDPQVLQVVNVIEGSFFKQNNAQTSFNQRVDPSQGKLFIALVRQAGTGYEANVNGTGGLIAVTFKALKAVPSAKVTLLSASPEPAPATPITVPMDHVVRVIP